ncbi:MAG: co-chaperone GroES [Mesorhizobium sp.]|nr:MAG: co-chaperone GroES [Mesorhizobium sp.]
MKFRPLHDRVVIRRAESDTKSKGGIIIPDNAKEKPQEGEVIAVGPGARDESGALIALDVKAGDLILFGKWSGTEVKIDGEDLLIMKEADIMGIIDKSEMGIIDTSEMGIIDKSEMGIIEKTGAAKKAA